MPETPHHALELHISFRSHITGTITDEVLKYLDNYTLWYAIKHELGDNGKVHLHCGLVKEIAVAGEDINPKAGAVTASNFKRALLRRCPHLQTAANDSSVFGIVVAPMKSDVLIAEYMQKEGDLKYFNMPADLVELTPYFADLQAKKPKNADYADWAKIYDKEQRPLPATQETVWEFLGHHMYVKNDMKIVADRKKMMERTDALVAFINMEAPPLPSTKRKAEEPPERYCKGGMPWCTIEPLAKYRKMCDGCSERKY